jgi:hypothetical protein
VVLTTGCNRLARGFDVVVEGDAIPFADVAVLERLNRRWRTLWGEGWPLEFRDAGFYETSGEPFLVFAVKPTKIFAYTRGDQWRQTRYQS